MLLRTFFICFTILGAMLSAGAARAETQSEYDDALDNLQTHSEKLSSLKARTCPADYRKFRAERNLRIGVYFGYMNFEPEADDPPIAKAFAKVLTQPCIPNLGVCGFRLVKSVPQAYLLQKSLRDGRTVDIEVHNSALTEDNTRNMTELAAQQRNHSFEVRDSFNAAIDDSDVVLYIGHARYGGGMGFLPAKKIVEGLNIVFKNPLRGTVEALHQAKRLKVFGVLACETERHYKTELEEANPEVDLILSQKILELESVYETGLGAIDSILQERCAPEVTAALTTNVDSGDEKGNPTGGKDAVIYFRGSKK